MRPGTGKRWQRRLIGALLSVLVLLTLPFVAAMTEDADAGEQSGPAVTGEETSPGQMQDQQTGSGTETSSDDAAQTPSGDGEADHPAGDGEQAPGGGEDPGAEWTQARQVQAMLDALPDPETITAENRADVEAALSAIDGAKLALTDGERAGLDVTRYEAAVAALAALDDMAGADEPMAAEVSGVPYVEANGTARTCASATVVEDEMDVWNAGWYVVNGNVTIAQRVEITGSVDLILADGCSLTASKGISVLEGDSLTIWGQSGGSGSLTADGRDDSNGWNAGIGGVANHDAGTVTINGGVITAFGGTENAGIGSYMAFGSITINGGTVTASGYVGIGTRGESGRHGGPITITGGTVTASGVGSNAPTDPGIGGRVKSVTITGGTVTANGGGSNAGIGVYDEGSITISGGTVTANGGKGYGASTGGAGITSDHAGPITITGGTVTATGGDHPYSELGDNGTGGAGISGSAVTVSGGTVTANGGKNGSGSVYFGVTGGFSTGDSGNAVVYSNEINVNERDRGSWSGVVFEGDGSEGQVYGSPTLTKDLEIKEGQTLTVPEGSTLTVGGGVTLTNDGAIQNDGNIVKDAKGSIRGSGRIYNNPVEGYELSIRVPVFAEVKYGYARPAAMAVKIQNTGRDTLHISQVELTGDTDAFDFTGPLSGDLPVGGAGMSCTVRPKAGLSVGSYEAAVTVTYDFGCTATADVTFTVGQADGTGTLTMADYTCGDTGAEPDARSDTNEIFDITYAAKGTDFYDLDKPTDPGEYTVRVDFSENDNYLGFSLTADFKVTHQFNAGWEQREDGYHHTCACGAELLLKTEALTAVPAGLASAYPSVEALTQALVKQLSTGADYAVYDVTLKLHEAGGEWRDAAPADFPAKGVAVTVPYPEGASANDTFTAVHMFAAGANAGKTETLAVTKGTDGITFTVKSLSPIAVGWRAPAPGSTSAGSAPNTGDPSQPALWLAVLGLALLGLAAAGGGTLTGRKGRRRRR